jgi:hypothetical protein
MSIASLPFRQQQSDENVHFLCTSKDASAMEMAVQLVDIIKTKLQHGIVSFDPDSGNEVLVVGTVLCLLGDAPMHSEMCSHIGTSGSRFCRMCDASYQKEMIPYPMVLEKYMAGGVQRTLAYASSSMNAQIVLAKERVKSHLIIHQSSSGVKDTLLQPCLEALLANPDSDHPQHMNPFLGLQELDVFVDTPVEILHTVLLGPFSDLIGSVNKALSPKQQAECQTALRSLFVDGLDFKVEPNAYVNHSKSLHGRDFKALMQIGYFAYHSYIDGPTRDLWKSLSKLCVIVYVREIKNVDDYCARLDKCVDEVLASAVRLDSLLLAKKKFHFLRHLSACVRRFGPPLLYATEKFESFNKFIRSAAINSNRQAPSRDIANEFARGFQLRLILSGGFIQMEPGAWYQASDKVRRITSDDAVQRAIGFRVEPSMAAQTRRKYQGIQSVSSQSNQVQRALIADQHEVDSDIHIWNQAKVGMEEIDKKWIQEGTFVLFFTSPNVVAFARVLKILTITHDCLDVKLVARRYRLKKKPDGSLDRLHDCPILVEEDAVIVLLEAHIQSAVNAQHVCDDTCKPDRRLVKQERQISNVYEDFKRHGNEREFYLNIFALRMPDAITSLVEIHGIRPEGNPADPGSANKSEITRFCEYLRDCWASSPSAQSSRHSMSIASVQAQNEFNYVHAARNLMSAFGVSTTAPSSRNPPSNVQSPIAIPSRIAHAPVVAPGPSFAIPAPSRIPRLQATSQSTTTRTSRSSGARAPSPASSNASGTSRTLKRRK